MEIYFPLRSSSVALCMVGPNGSGKSTIMKAIAARAIPIPEALDIYFLDSEYPARDDITALGAVMESNDEVNLLEKKAEALNLKMAEADEEEQLEIQAQMEGIYGRLDQLDASTAESRATSILFGLGFTTAMQHQKTNEFSGGWRVRSDFQYTGLVLRFWLSNMRVF